MKTNGIIDIRVVTAQSAKQSDTICILN
jgi:hypothetical protein